MRISKEISGNSRRRNVATRQGRGEYEICENFGATTPKELLNRRIFIDLPDGNSINSWINLKLQGGKRRIRTIANGKSKSPYPHRQVAAALLMPEPSRSEPSWGEGAPVLRSEQYGIIHLDITNVVLVRDDEVRIAFGTIQSMNQYQQESIDFAKRYFEVKSVWDNKLYFDPITSKLLQDHEKLVLSGGPVGIEAEQIVRMLQKEMAQQSGDYHILGNSPTTDVLPSLLQVIQRVIAHPRVDIASIPPTEIEIRRRTVKEWRTWAASRGAESMRFRREVRAAYRATCVVCGLRFPSLGQDTIPGVDAAHILPWSEFNLDHIQNGLCLCKTHHWAFDERLIEIQWDGTAYVVSIPDDAYDKMDESPGFSTQVLRSFAGPIPLARLPDDRTAWPSHAFLKALREALAP